MEREEVPVADALALRSACELEAALRAREVSSRELLEMFVSQMGRLNPEVNAIVTTDLDRAYERAGQVDEAGARGEWVGPLHGLPFTVKDAIETAGIRSTGGAVELAHHVPEVDAPAVARLREAGGVLFGKTNAPRWSGDFQTYNELFGTTNNPWDLGRTTGGSSGGSAAAVASGMTSFEMGTDIGGSIRVPSGFCGVFGHKPSFGIVPQRGYLDRVGGGTIDADINVFGPLARSVDDLELLLDVLAGPGVDDAPAWRLDLPTARAKTLRELRVGTWLDDPKASVDSEVGDVLQSAADAWAAAGVGLSSDHPELDMAEVFQMFLALTGAATAVSPDSQVTAINHRQWLDLTEERNRVRAVWRAWFQDHDILLCPVMPIAAVPHDTSRPFAERTALVNGQPRTHIDCAAWTGLIGVAYLPSTVIPAGRTVSGLPVGVQVVGPYVEDRTCLEAARLLSSVIGPWEAPPISRDPATPGDT
jgi:amidase